MKITFSKLTLAAIFALALAFTTSCVEKGGGNSSTTAVTIDKRIVGTWEDENGRTYVINPDGTGEHRGRVFKYSFFSDKIIMSLASDGGRYSSGDNSTSVMNYVFSTDGKTFIVYNSLGASWLTKKEAEKKE